MIIPYASPRFDYALPGIQTRANESNYKMKQSRLTAILTDVHLWVPAVVLILGITLLMTLR
jgi:hypothetical protein